MTTGLDKGRAATSPPQPLRGPVQSTRGEGPSSFLASRLSPAHSHIPPQEEEGSNITTHTCQQPFTLSFPQRAAKCCFQEAKHVFSTVITGEVLPRQRLEQSPSTHTPHTQLEGVTAGWVSAAHQGQCQTLTITWDSL